MKHKQKAMMTVLALVTCSGICAVDHLRPESRSLNSNSRIKPLLAPLTVLCFSSTAGAITLTIRAGATGAPAVQMKIKRGLQLVF
jgi:hypothetical protein